MSTPSNSPLPNHSSQNAEDVTVTPSLSTKNLSIRFGGHVAVDGVSADFYPGSLTVIVGPNGAGKTTYFNLMSGQLKPTAGSVHLFGKDITHCGAAQKTRLGLGRAFQLTNLFPNLSVHENVRLATQSAVGIGLHFFSIWSSHRQLIEKADDYLHQVALFDRRHDLVATLSHGDKRKLEVAILLALEPRVMMFDEPTAGMSVDEMPVVIELIQKIKEDASKTILLVEHKMDVLRALADRVLVLHQGCLVADGKPQTVMASAVVQEAYLGGGVAA